MRTITSLTTAILLGVLMLPLTAGAQSADAIAKRLNDKYQPLTSLRAEFTQTMTSQYSDIREQQAGVLLLRGEDYLLDTGDEIYARSGEDVWRYSRGENQVIVSNYMEDEATFSVNDLFFRYDELFNIVDIGSETYEGARHFRVTLEPKESESFFSEVTLWLRDQDDIVTRIHMIDMNGTRMDFRLENVELNPAVASNAFAPPSGAEVVNLR